jgi:hypothetical protein
MSELSTHLISQVIWIINRPGYPYDNTIVGSANASSSIEAREAAAEMAVQWLVDQNLITIDYGCPVPTNLSRRVVPALPQPTTGSSINTR